MRLAPVLLAILLAIPAAAARPIEHEGDDYHGVATQGSVDSWEDWFEGEDGGCGDMLTPFRVTLRVLDGAPADALLLDVEHGPASMVAVATQLSPATIEGTSGDACPTFTVTGLLVAGEAPYVVTVERL